MVLHPSGPGAHHPDPVYRGDTAGSGLSASGPSKTAIAQPSLHFFFFLISLARGLSVFGHFQKLHSNLFSLFLFLYSLIPLFYFPLFFLLTLALVCSFFSSSDLRPFLFSYQRKQWQPNPVLLPGKSYGRRRLQSMGLRRLGHD